VRVRNIAMGTDIYGLELGELPDMVTVEMRMCQILAERKFMEVSGTRRSPGLFMILALISKNPGQKQSTLAQSVQLDRSTLVPILDYCEREGLLERKPYLGDRRAHAIFLTRQGKSLVRKLSEKVGELEEQISTGMGKRDRQQLLRLLKKFQASVTSDKSTRK
jgi:DNA-binding MarR family transcriptional regulator